MGPLPLLYVSGRWEVLIPPKFVIRGHSFLRIIAVVRSLTCLDGFCFQPELAGWLAGWLAG